MLSPIVYWGQTASTISLRADLKHTKNHKIEIKESELHFTGEGIGAHGQDEYTFSIRFFEPIESDVSTLVRDVGLMRRIRNSCYRIASIASLIGMLNSY